MHPYQHSAHDTRPHSCRILKSIDDVVSIRTEWDRLWVAARAGYSLSFSYVHESWNTIHRPQGAELCCVVLIENDRLLAALPMVLLRGKVCKYASICTPEAAEGCDILVERSTTSQAMANALLEKLLISARPDLINFYFVKSGCHLELAIQSLPRLRIVEAYDNAMPYADLKAEVDWAPYKRSLSKHYESNVARKTRRLHEQGEVTVEIVRGASTPAIGWLFLQKRKWSERTNKRGDWVFSSRYQEFVTKLFTSDPRFLVFVLKLDDSPIAVKLAAISSSLPARATQARERPLRRLRRGPGAVLRAHKYDLS